MAEADRDGAALGRELDGIRDEIVEQLSEPNSIAAYGRHRREPRDELDLLLGRARTRCLDALAHDQPEIDRFILERKLAGLDLGDEEQISDEAQQSPGVALDDGEKLALVLGDLAGLTFEHELEVAENRRQRCAELVRDEGDELVLHRVEGPQLLVLTLKRLEQLLALLLGSLAVRDVEQVALGVHGPSLVVVNDHRFVPEPDHSPVAGQEPVLLDKRLLGPVRTRDLCEHTIPVLRVENALEEFRVPCQASTE